MLGPKYEFAELLMAKRTQQTIFRRSSSNRWCRYNLLTDSIFFPDLGQAAKCALQGKCEMQFVSFAS